MSELRECPFCGSREERPINHAEDCFIRMYAENVDEYYYSETLVHDRESMMVAWNTRAERTCHYFPDSMQVAFDENDEEIETGEAFSDGCDYTCSACGFTMLGGDEGWFDETPGEYGGWDYKARFNYCPNCGAKVSE